MHLGDLSRPFSDLPRDVPSLFKPFSVDALLDALRGLLAG